MEFVLDVVKCLVTLLPPILQLENIMPNDKYFVWLDNISHPSKKAPGDAADQRLTKNCWVCYARRKRTAKGKPLITVHNCPDYPSNLGLCFHDYYTLLNYHVVDERELQKLFMKVNAQNTYGHYMSSLIVLAELVYISSYFVFPHNLTNICIFFLFASQIRVIDRYNWILSDADGLVKYQFNEKHKIYSNTLSYWSNCLILTPPVQAFYIAYILYSLYIYCTFIIFKRYYK